MKRSFQASTTLLLSFSIVKYLSLVFVGVTGNLAPIFCSIMSYFMTGEKLKPKDIVFMLISFIGVTIVTIGFEQKSKPDQKSPETWKEYLRQYLAIILALALPINNAWGNIINRQMKKLNQKTVSCYISPLVTVVMVIIIYVQDIS